MNESKKFLVVLGVIVFVILGTIGFAFASSNKSEELYLQFEQAFNGDKNTLVYIGSSSCGYCSLLNPSLTDMKERYGFDYLYIDVNEMNKSHMSKLLSYLGLTKVGTPYLAIVANGKVVNTQNGYADYDVTFKFLQDNGIIAENAELLLNYIDGYEEYEKLLKSDDKSIIVVGQSTCGYCVQAKVILNEIAEENDVTINYLNVSYLTEEEGEKFTNSLDYFAGNWGTPVMMITKDGEMVDIIEQLVTKEEYVEFLEKNEVL